MISRIGPGLVALIGVGTDDTAEEVAPLVKKVLGAKLWNEGLTAEHIRQQRGAGTGLVAAAIGANPSLPPASAAEPAGQAAEGGSSQPAPADGEANGDAAGTGAGAGKMSRAEEVWGGKPWKTNVADLQGEILCGESWRASSLLGPRPRMA